MDAANLYKAEVAEKGLDVYCKAMIGRAAFDINDADNAEDPIASMICSLAHLCAKYDLDVARVMARAAEFYLRDSE